MIVSLTSRLNCVQYWHTGSQKELQPSRRVARTIGRIVGLVVLTATAFALVGWPMAMVLHAAWQERGVPEPGLSLAPQQASLALQTFWLVVCTLAIALLIGVPVGLALFRTDVPGRSLGRLFVLLPALVPIELQATAWLAAAGPQGAARALGLPIELNGLLGAAWVHAMAAIPWVVALVGVAASIVEAELEEDCLLVAGPVRTMWHVTLRRSAGVVVAAGLFVAVNTAGEMAVTDLLRVRTYAETVYTEFALAGRAGAATATAVPGLAVWFALVALAGWLVARRVPQDVQALFARRPVFQLGCGRWAAFACVLLVVAATFAIPVGSLVWRTGVEYPRPAVLATESGMTRDAAGSNGVQRAVGLRWTAASFGENFIRSARSARDSLFLSLRVAAATALVSVLAAWPLAVFARQSRAGQWLAFLVAGLLVALPGPVLGIGVTLALRWPVTWWGGEPAVAGLVARVCSEVAASPIVLVWLNSLRTLPFALAVLWPIERLVNRALVEAAATDGATPLRRLWHVEFPSCRLAIVAAAFVCSVLAIGELAGSVIVYPAGYDPLSVRIFNLAHRGLENQLAGICLVLLGAAAAGSGAVYLCLRLTVSRIKE
jgi:iron(III) transport system permease protein